MTPEEKRNLLRRSMESEQLESGSLTPQQKRELLKKHLLESPIAPDKDISMTESLLGGAVRGATYGLADEAQGALEAGRGVFRGEFSPDELSENYRAGRQEARERQESSMATNPVATGAGMVAGGVAASVVPGLNLGRAARLGKYGQSAAAGALYGYGESESDNPLVQTEDVAKGAALGAGIQKGFEHLPGRQALQEALKRKAAEKAVKSSGAMTREFRKLDKKGFVQPQGEFLLEKKIVTPFASLEDVAERSGAVRQSAGERIGGIIDKADSLRERALSGIMGRAQAGSPNDRRMAKEYANQVNSTFGYSFENVANRIEGLMQRDSKVAPAVAYHFPQLQKLSDTFRGLGRSGSLREGLANKTEQRKLLKDVDSLAEEYKQEIYDIISDELERGVSELPRLEAGVGQMDSLLSKKAPGAVKPSYPQLNPQGSSGLPAVSGDGVGLVPDAGKGGDFSKEAEDIVSQWRQANREYAGSAVAEKTARDRLGGVRSNRDFGLTTSIAANAGLLAGGAPGAMALGGLNNFLRKYGSTLQATGYWKLAKMLESQPEALGKYATPLREAMGRGANQFLLTNYLIAKGDPHYQGLLNSLIESEAVPQ